MGEREGVGANTLGAEPDRQPRDARTLEAGGLPTFKLRRVTAHIDTYLYRELWLAELIAVVHMSPSHFARLFKQSTGVSPHRFVIHRRIEKASTLLATSGLSIRAIAWAVGFKTYGHFATTFRRLTGVTPRAQRTATAPPAHRDAKLL